MLNLSKNRKDLNLRVSFIDNKYDLRTEEGDKQQNELKPQKHVKIIPEDQVNVVDKQKNKFQPIYIEQTLREQPLNIIKEIKNIPIKQPQWYSWYILVGSLFCSGFIGPLFLIISIQDNLLVLPAVWRYLMVTLFMLPATFIDYAYKKQKEEAQLYQQNIIFDQEHLKTLGICGFFHAIWIGSLSYSVHFTNMANAYLFNNIFLIFFIVIKIYQKQKITIKEKLGILIVLIGMSLLFGDTDSVYSDVVALIGSLSATFYQLKCKILKNNYPWIVAINLISLFSCMFLMLYSFIIEGASFDNDNQTGLFGVFSQQWFVKHIWISIITGIFILIANSHCNDIFDSLLVDFVHLLEPIVSQFTITLMQYQDLPNRMTWIGLFIAIFGEGMIATGKQESDIEEIQFPDYGIFNDQKSDRFSNTSDTMANYYIEMNTIFKQGIIKKQISNNSNN